MIGELVGSYRIVSAIGEGGMGAVFLGEHQVIGRRAAIKVLLPELSNNREVVERFFNEARSSALIRHQGIVDILDFGHRPDGRAFIVMEYLEGESLGSRLRRVGRLPEASAVAIARQAAGALAAAHAQGIIHRDLKPDNIYLVPDPDLLGGARIKILDFGIAKLSSGAAGMTVARTRTGAVMGSPLYMSPEQSRGARAVDERSDIYSLGCVFFEMLAGRPPFLAEGAGEVIGMHIYEKAPRVRSFERGVSSALDGLIARTLAKQPESRPRSMTELIEAIDKATNRRYATNATETAPPARPAASAPGPSPTTLGSGIGEVTVPPAPRRRWPLLVASLVVAGAAVAAIAAVVSSQGSPVPAGQATTARPAAVPAVDAAPAKVVAAPAPPDAAPVKVVAAAAPPDASPAREAAALPAPEPRMIELGLSSRPTAATVSLNGTRLAVTPCKLQVPWSAEVRVRVQVALEGYRPQELRVLPDRDVTHDIVLVPLRHETEPRPPAPAPTAPPPPKRAKGDPVDPFAK